MHDAADIQENELWRKMPEVLIALLRDHTTGRNIFWATDDYASRGAGYCYRDELTPEAITGENGHVIVPRVLKDAAVQDSRKRSHAEIFTPLWIVNTQVNLIDEAWFGRKHPFNIEHDDHTWTPVEEPIAFSEEKGKTWRDYVRDTRLEITCGEGPYLTSRYDPTTGEYIPVRERIGMVDRKLRVVGERTTTTGEWLEAAQEALKSAYGYEWQGDSLLLARENLFYTWLEHYQAKFGNEAMPLERSCKSAAYIISWNVFQMDGLKGVVPDSCHPLREPGLFGEDKVSPCPGCEKGDIRQHNGTYCLIRDWNAKPLMAGEGPGRKIRFIDLMKR